MHRREVLRLLATGSLLQLAPPNLFAVLREAHGLIQSQTSPRTLNAHQHATVKAMAEMIIPRTDTPGALDVGTAEFVDLILTEWYEEAERTRFLSGLADVDSRSQSLFGKNFVEGSSLQQSDILMALGEKMVEEVGEQPRPLRRRGTSTPANFYAMLRQLTLTAYYTSEAGATDELHFEMIPGSYQGCPAEPIKEESKQQ
jgi:glucoside 3-dehydrogenase (cytochrome c) hitch-hiker subunit